MGILDVLGGKNKAVEKPKVDPNAFQYGGRAGAAGEEANYYRSQAQATDAREAPLADYGQSNQARGVQQEAIDLTRQAALGQAPSVAQQQMQMGTDAAIANQLAAAASAGGTGPAQAAAWRAAQNQGSALAQQAVAQNSLLRAQEMADARNALAAQATGMRGQDLNASQFQAQQQLASRSANDQRAIQEELLRQGVMGQHLQAQQNYAQLQANVGAQNAQAERSNVMGVIGGLASVLSDVRAKSDVDPVAPMRLAGVAPMSGQMARMGPSRDKPVTGQDVRNSIKSASEQATPEMRITPAAGAGAGVAGGNAALFAPGGLFGPKSEDGSIPTTSMTKPADGLMGFVRGAQSVYSDERAKAATPGGKTADAFLETLKNSAATYRYTDPALEPRDNPTGGKYLGVMAQDLARTPGIGPQLVSQTPDGMLAIEGGAAQSALLGGMGRLTERLEKLERKVGSRRG
jgi:hypothetical protein